MDSIETIFLVQGEQTPESVAERLAGFVSQARQTIDICIYSFSLCPEPREILLSALRERAEAGVTIRIAYDAGTQEDMIPEAGNDICDLNTPDFVQGLGFPSKAIEGRQALMHHKYVVIDAGTPQGRVWTGSANFTDDSWTLQENNILILRSPELADCYTHDFNELWVDANIRGGHVLDGDEATLRYKGEAAHVSANFAPAEGEWIDDMLARRVAQTQERVTLAFVVLTSGDIIEAMLGLIDRNVPIEGIYDRSQMESVKHQWSLVPDNHWKIGAFAEIVQYGRLVGKNSTPYTPESKHDFMHNKVMVLDDVVVTGSYNFSRHAQQNAENVLLIKSEPLADTYRRYIDKLKMKYARAK